jgi:hypothetical protein
MKKFCDENRIRNGQVALSIGFVAVVCFLAHPLIAGGAAVKNSLTSVIALQRREAAPAPLARGTVTVKRTPAGQEFIVDVRNIYPTPPSLPAGGLAVFLANNTNVYLVNVMQGSGTNGTWRLNLKSNIGAPAQLAVPDVTNLVGKVVYISDTTSNVYLQTTIRPFVSSPAALSYTRRSILVPSSSPPSPDAIGEVLVKLNGTRGTSLFQVRAQHLSKGNAYCIYLLPDFGFPAQICDSVSNLLNGASIDRVDTKTGESIFGDGPLTNGVVRIDQLSGMVIEIRDNFGATHLRGYVP